MVTNSYPTLRKDSVIVGTYSTKAKQRNSTWKPFRRIANSTDSSVMPGNYPSFQEVSF